MRHRRQATVDGCRHQAGIVMVVEEKSCGSLLMAKSSSTLPCPGYSMWNPWKGGWTAEIPGGFHGMVDGFHGFSTWIPYLFQLDSIPFPYGIQLE